MPWYCYKSGPPCQPTSYKLFGTFAPSCPFPKRYVCAIQANDNSGLPIITLALCIEINLALVQSVDSTNVKLQPTASCFCK